MSLAIPDAIAATILAICVVCLTAAAVTCTSKPPKPEPVASRVSDAEHQLAAVRDLHARWLDRIEALRRAEASEVVIMALDRCATELDATLQIAGTVRFDTP